MGKMHLLSGGILELRRESELLFQLYGFDPEATQVIAYELPDRGARIAHIIVTEDDNDRQVTELLVLGHCGPPEIGSMVRVRCGDGNHMFAVTEIGRYSIGHTVVRCVPLGFEHRISDTEDPMPLRPQLRPPIRARPAPPIVYLHHPNPVYSDPFWSNTFSIVVHTDIATGLPATIGRALNGALCAWWIIEGWDDPFMNEIVVIEERHQDHRETLRFRVENIIRHSTPNGRNAVDVWLRPEDGN